MPKKKTKIPLSKSHPKLAKEADGWDPNTVTKGSHKKLRWKCSKQHVWNAAVKDRTAGKGCRKCYLASTKKFTSLAIGNPALAKQAFGWDPKEFGIASSKKKLWKCKLGHTWEATIRSRFGSRGCPYCSNNKIWAGFNDIATTHPEVSKTISGTDPKTISAGSEKKVKWECSIGHIYELEVKKRIGRNYGCPYCSNSKLLKGFNDFATRHPEFAREADGWDPSTVIGGSAVYRQWKCKNGHRYRSKVSSKDASSSGCPTCARGGFDPNQSGYMYLITHLPWQSLQIGITNFPDERLRTHKRLGWEVVEIRGPMDGHLTQQWETAILQMLKHKGADLSNSKIAGKFDGYSEAWSKSTFSVKSIKELMRLTEEFEESK